MLVIGLTGSIGMGKSSAATMLRRMGLPLHDADKAVHRLMGRGGAAVADVEAAFPGVVVDGAVDRKRLGKRVFGKSKALARLEAILHPIVRNEAHTFLQQQARHGRWAAVLDIPLLFETGGDRLCDAVIVVTAPAFVQKTRVMGRAGMTPARFRAIRAKQMSEREKCRRADFVVNTGLSKAQTLRRLHAIVTLLRQRRNRRRRRATAWSPRRVPSHPRPRKSRA